MLVLAAVHGRPAAVGAAGVLPVTVPGLGCGAGQVRARVLNDQLADDFHRWYPGLSRTLDPMTLAA